MPVKAFPSVVAWVLVALLCVPTLASAFSWTNISMQSTCEKAWSCGFKADFINASSDDFGQPINIYVLENNYPIEQVYRYVGEEPVFYTLPSSTSGTVNGFFVPGHFMQSQRSYTLLVQYGNQSINTSFQLNVYRQPDVLGDLIAWGAVAAFYIVLGLIGLFILVFLFRVFVLIFFRRR